MEMVPKWEDLNMDCLVNIFGRLDMENLLLDVPFVCKSWYKATCDPQCWTVLDFTGGLSDDEVYYDRDLEESAREGNDSWDSGFPKRITKKYRLYKSSTMTSFIMYVVKRGGGCTTFVRLPPSCTKEALVYISNECPNLKTLKLSGCMEYDLAYLVPSLVSKWERLENLCLSRDSNICEILANINAHCKNLGTIEILFGGRIGEDEASALVTFVPNLKCLTLRCVDISKECLLKILNGCKKLEYLDSRDCVGFEENDDDILNCAAHILTLNLEGSTLNQKNDSDYDYYDLLDCYESDYYDDSWQHYDSDDNDPVRYMYVKSRPPSRSYL